VTKELEHTPPGTYTSPRAVAEHKMTMAEFVEIQAKAFGSIKISPAKAELVKAAIVAMLPGMVHLIAAKLAEEKAAENKS
jgi:hypothetical protein